MEKLPFDFIPQIFRYLEEIIRLNDAEVADDGDNWIVVQSYIPPEKPTEKIEALNYGFWTYLEEIGAIKLSDDNKLVVGKKIEGEISERSDKTKWFSFSKYRLRVLDIQKIKALLDNRNHQFIIKPKTLELISKDIGEFDTGTNLVEFLGNCGVDSELILYPNTKWRMIYAIFRTLATSPKPEDQKILFKIIEEAVHPLMHNGDEEIANKYVDKFNRLLGYDGFTLKNYKLKKLAKEAKQDNDLDLYLKKKILVENWRDDLPHPITELSFTDNTVEQICYSLWDLFISDVILFGVNTYPENILIETDPRFHQEIAFNWQLIRDLDNNPDKVDDNYSFDIELLDEKRLEKDIEEEINEFITNKVEMDKLEKVKDFYPDTKYFETPSFLRGIPANYYAYKKQREVLLSLIANLYDKFENEILVINFNEIKDKNVSVLRTILALEKEGFFTIKELRNDKEEWIDKDNVYVKISLDKKDIPIIKEFKIKTTEPDEDIDFSDTASRKGWEKKWDVLQAIWTTYNGNSQADSIFVRASVLLIKDRSDVEINGILDGLKKEDCFADWQMAKDKVYFEIKDINHNKFIKIYQKTGFIYDKFAKVYQEKSGDNIQKIQIVSGSKMEVEGLQDGLKSIAKAKKEDKNKFPHKLPAGTRWENFIIKFVDDENVDIQVGQFKHTANYKDIVHLGKGKIPKPSVLWDFLKILAKLGGEISIKDKESRETYKKQKELLTKCFQEYFSIDYDLFFPYHSAEGKESKTYKIKVTLIPLPDQTLNDDGEEEDDLGVAEEYKKQTPSLYEDS